MSSAVKLEKQSVKGETPVKAVKFGHAVQIGGQSQTFVSVGMPGFVGIEMTYQAGLIKIVYKNESIYVPMGNIAFFVEC